MHTSNLGEMFLSLVVDEIDYEANFSPNISDFNTTSIKNSDTTSDTSTLTYSIRQGLESLIDDALLAFASAQLLLNYNTSVRTVDGTLTTSGIQFGTKPYVYAIFAFNILLILFFIEEAFRTHFWAALPSSKYNDLRSVIVASSIGGAKLGNKGSGLIHREEHSSAGMKYRTADKAEQLLNEEQDTLKWSRAEGDSIELLERAEHALIR